MYLLEPVVHFILSAKYARQKQLSSHVVICSGSYLKCHNYTYMQHVVPLSA